MRFVCACESVCLHNYTHVITSENVYLVVRLIGNRLLYYVVSMLAAIA